MRLGWRGVRQGSVPAVGAPARDDGARGLGWAAAWMALAASIALAWANSPAAAAYRALLGVMIGTGRAALPLQGWINDGLMSVFFVLAGLEIRRALSIGCLASWRAAAAPGSAALGGMLAAACVYLAVNRGSAGTAHGWAVPIGMDSVFSVSVLRILGRDGLAPVRGFLTDAGVAATLIAIAAMVAFYPHHVEQDALHAAGLAVFMLMMLRGVGVRGFWAYWAGAALIWWLMFHSGVAAPLAGLALAFTLPGNSGDAGSAPRRMERLLHPYVYAGVLPIFVFFNAGVALQGQDWAGPTPLGVFLGLVVGKPVGMFLAVWLGRSLEMLQLPVGMGMQELVGASLLAGGGLTLCLYLNLLAFRGAHSGVAAAILAGSFVSASGGALVLGFSRVR